MIQIKFMQEHQKTLTCQKKGLLLDKTQKEHYYEKNNIQETQKQHYESAKCQYCATYAKTNDEVNEKFGLQEMEKYIADVKVVWTIYAYGKQHIMKNNKNKIQTLWKQWRRDEWENIM